MSAIARLLPAGTSGIVASGLLLLASPALAQAGAVEDSDELPPATGEELLAIVNEPWKGDLDGIRERGLLRVITTYNRTNFFIENGQGRGLEFEAMTRFGAWWHHN